MNKSRLLGLISACVTVFFCASPHAAPIGTLYVAAEDSDTIAVINAATATMIASINVGAGSAPHNPALSPDGQSVWVTLKSTGQVARIDVATKTLVGTYGSGGGDPVHLAFSPDGSSVYVTNQANDAITKLDAGTGAITGSYILPGDASTMPHDVKASADGNVWVTDQTAGQVHILDANLTGVLGTLPVGSDPITLASSIDGSQMFVANRGSSSISVLDIAGQTNVTDFPLNFGMGPMVLVADPDGSGLWVTETGNNTLTHVSLVPGDNYSYTNLFGLVEVHGLTVSADGQYVYATLKESFNSLTRDAVVVIDVATETVISTITTPGFENLHGIAYVSDSDGDGLPDSVEDSNGNGIVDPGETDPQNPDSDGDGLTDGQEDSNLNGVVDGGESDPLNFDTDGDGLTDGYEVNIVGTDPGSPTTIYTDPGDMDNDGDVDLGDHVLHRQRILNP